MVDLPLVRPEELEGFPGAPFSAGVVAAASDAVRSDAEWHIAPLVQETVEVETGRSRVALLPSLRVEEVTEVRDADTGKVLEGWRVSKSRLTRVGGVWPEAIEVDMSHGYDECPAALRAVVAERAQHVKSGAVSQESLGSRSVSYRQDYDPTNRATLARYKLSPRA